MFAPHPTPTHERSFDAGYIFINGGYMEVGTEAFPYTSKLTITMHGDVSTPALPTYGNKVIAVRMGTLSMVGKERKVVWTELDKTVLA
ncbi:MAG: G8 domain-containing protein [bacterium]